jgi:hypothetical protein
MEAPLRAVTVVLLATACLGTGSLKQDAHSPQQPEKTESRIVNTQDGGVSEVLQSIEIPPKPLAPFTLTLETEWVKMLPDGGTVTWVNKRRIARDSAGRIYQERWALIPKGDPRVKAVLTVIQIEDPNEHTLYNCFIITKTNTCELLTYSASASSVYKPLSPKSGPLPEDQGVALHEDLGTKFIFDVQTEGTHDTVTYNPGAFGNDRKLTVEKEFWYSAQLGISLSSIRTDPQIGKQTFTVTSLNVSEPDPALFELPAGFKIVDHRQTAPPQASPPATR